MAKPTTSSWMGIPGSIGQHLMKGRLVLAHVWDSHGKAWMSLMCEAPDRNTTPPVHGPYTDMDTAKKAAELGFGYPKIPLAR